MPRVVRYRDYLRDEARIMGSRAFTSGPWHFHAAGCLPGEIMREYPTLEPWQVLAAIDFEARWFRRLVRWWHASRGGRRIVGAIDCLVYGVD